MSKIDESVVERRCRELSVVITNHLGGGSEWFSRIGDPFYAEPKICADELQRRKTDAQITKRALFRANAALSLAPQKSEGGETGAHHCGAPS